MVATTCNEEDPMTPRRLAQLFTVVSGLATLLALLFASLPARANEEAPITRLIEEWLSSPHGNYHSRSFTYWNKEGEVPTNCATCHSETGFHDFLGVDGSAAGTIDRAGVINSPIGCASCHTSQAHALDSVRFPSGVEVTGLGNSATCTVCHQGRQSGAAVTKAVAELGEDDVSVMVRLGMSISIMSPSRTRPIAPPSAASGETWPIDRPEVPPEKRPSVSSAQAFAEALRLQVAGRIEHFLHARPAARALIADHDDIAGLDLVVEDAFDRRILALEDLGRAGEFQDRLVDAGRLHDAAVERDVALEHGEAAILREGVLGRADDARFAVEIEILPAPVLAEGDLRRHAAGRGHRTLRTASLWCGLMSQRSIASPSVALCTVGRIAV
jgi:hypothetical protein